MQTTAKQLQQWKSGGLRDTRPGAGRKLLKASGIYLALPGVVFCLLNAWVKALPGDTMMRRPEQDVELRTQHPEAAAFSREMDAPRTLSEEARCQASREWITFRHIFFDGEKRGADAEVEAREALLVLKMGASADGMGDRFLQGTSFASLEMKEVSALFGPVFTGSLMVQDAGAWRGPIRSSYGLHLVHVEKRTAARPAALEEINSAGVRAPDEEGHSINREGFENPYTHYPIVAGNGN